MNRDPYFDDVSGGGGSGGGFLGFGGGGGGMTGIMDGSTIVLIIAALIIGALIVICIWFPWLIPIDLPWNTKKSTRSPEQRSVPAGTESVPKSPSGETTTTTEDDKPKGDIMNYQWCKALRSNIGPPYILIYKEGDLPACIGPDSKTCDWKWNPTTGDLSKVSMRKGVRCAPADIQNKEHWCFGAQQAIDSGKENKC
jgi:hypothetical protein